MQLSYSKASHIAFRIGLQNFLHFLPLHLTLAVSETLNPLQPPQLLSVSLSNKTFDTGESFCMCDCFISPPFSLPSVPHHSDVYLSKVCITTTYQFAYDGIYGKCLTLLALLNANHAKYSIPVHPLSLNPTITHLTTTNEVRKEHSCVIKGMG